MINTQAEVREALDALALPVVDLAGSLELRIANIRVNLAWGWPRKIPLPQPDRPGAIAVVGYGPSLLDTLDELREFRYIMTTSGAHKILLSKYITPTFHHDIETRPHKASMLGTPHPNIEYILTSTASPLLYDHLRGYKVSQVHVCHPPWLEVAKELPRGETVIRTCGGVGANAIALARYLGFTDIHTFGLDGSFPAKRSSHAGPHPYTVDDLARECTYEGRTFLTAPGFLYQTRGILLLRDTLTDAKITFHGDGLLQHMAPTYPTRIMEPPGVFYKHAPDFDDPDPIP